MKTHFRKSSKQGFTLVELIVAMAVTTLIITVLVGVTSVAIDAWKRSRAEVRASRQGKAMVDSMARDFESMVARKGNSFEWLYAKAIAQADLPGEGEQTIKTASSNALDLVFFTAATDRYDGGINTPNDKGGDVSCVGYKLVYQDPLNATGSYGTFSIYRKLVNPDDSFASLLGKNKDELKQAFDAIPGSISDNANFVCENVYQFTVTFMVEVTRTSGSSTTKLTVPVVMGPSQTNSLQVLGTGIDTTFSGGGATADEIKAGRLAGVQISLTVLTDFGLDQLRVRSFATDADRAKFFGQNSFEYSKLVELSGM
jgi:prepilin-type N-terminal cleavage/methylation domain-containing protein